MMVDDEGFQDPESLLHEVEREASAKIWMSTWMVFTKKQVVACVCNQCLLIPFLQPFPCVSAYQLTAC